MTLLKPTFPAQTTNQESWEARSGSLNLSSIRTHPKPAPQHSLPLVPPVLISWTSQLGQSQRVSGQCFIRGCPSWRQGSSKSVMGQGVSGGCASSGLTSPTLETVHRKQLKAILYYRAQTRQSGRQAKHAAAATAAACL